MASSYVILFFDLIRCVISPLRHTTCIVCVMKLDVVYLVGSSVVALLHIEMILNRGSTITSSTLYLVIIVFLVPCQILMFN